MRTIIIEYGLLMISFGLYFIISYLSKFSKLRNLKEALENPGRIRLLNFKHLTGIVLLGLLPLAYYSDYYSLFVSFTELTSIVMSSFIAISVIVCILAIKSASQVRLQPKFQFKTEKFWISNYFINRILFLISYEFFFRGIILYFFLNRFGLWPAIALTTALYVIIHAFDTKEEIIGAIPFGIVLCLYSYHGSIWMAIGLHLILSLTYELIIYRRFTEIKEIKT
ncbi:MAG: CPBP family intramembrane metalloprotease [Flavobacteriaceae bacterium]|nr:CPBP family intramembrane metalloprotease [Bacteroidia bacterium]MBT8268376.1 CPBP family intramembrane metalloprotease [Bacteroidia bacterium]NNL15646.1 CPBP family intramembrane metalloprotease [Flavobacteriaceae bacterium]NNL80291.1 CPBP family intramembrane metalloprotease [Flavobacteriaceae bacterium]